jgi:hypothetical protein
MLTSYIYGSIVKMLKGSEAHTYNFPIGIEKVIIMTMTYEINLNTITDEFVEMYNKLLHNAVHVADARRNRIFKDFQGTIDLLMLTGRLDNEEALIYIDILEDRLDDCRESFEESYESEAEKMMPCDYNGICAGTSCSQFFGCQA